MAKPPLRTIKGSVGKPSVSRSKLAQAAKVVSSRTATTGRFVKKKSARKNPRSSSDDVVGMYSVLTPMRPKSKGSVSHRGRKK